MLSKSVVLGWLWIGIVAMAMVLALVWSTAEPISPCQPGDQPSSVAADRECLRESPQRASAPDSDAATLPEILR